MTDLSALDTNELVNRWNSLEPQYLDLCAEFKEFLIKLEKIQNEMVLIQQELENRKINLNVEKEDH